METRRQDNDILSHQEKSQKERDREKERERDLEL